MALLVASRPLGKSKLQEKKYQKITRILCPYFLTGAHKIIEKMYGLIYGFLHACISAWVA